MIDHPFWLVLVILATARVVRFVCDDYLSKDFRLWVIDGPQPVKLQDGTQKLSRAGRLSKKKFIGRLFRGKFGEDSKISYLVHCRWCVAIWVSAAVVPFAWFGTGHLWAQIPITILAVALVAPALLSIDELKTQVTVNGREGEPWR